MSKEDYDTVKYSLLSKNDGGSKYLAEEVVVEAVEVIPNFKDVGFYSYPYNLVIFLSGMILLLASYLVMWFH